MPRYTTLRDALHKGFLELPGQVRTALLEGTSYDHERRLIFTGGAALLAGDAAPWPTNVRTFLRDRGSYLEVMYGCAITRNQRVFIAPHVLKAYSLASAWTAELGSSYAQRAAMRAHRFGPEYLAAMKSTRDLGGKLALMALVDA